MHIIIKDNIVQRVVSTKSPNTIPLQFGESIVGVPYLIPKGSDIRVFDHNWKLKPIQQLVDMGLKSIPEGYIIKGNKLVKTKPAEPSPREILQQAITRALSDLSHNCNTKRSEILDDKRIMNILVGATEGYPEYLTKDNTAKLIEIFKGIYHTYKSKIEVVSSLEELQEIEDNIVYPTLEYILDIITKVPVEEPIIAEEPVEEPVEDPVVIDTVITEEPEIEDLQVDIDDNTVANEEIVNTNGVEI